MSRRGTVRRKFSLLPYLMLLPATLVILSVTAYPFIYSLSMSFFDFSFLKQGMKFIGFKNYRDIISKGEFLSVLGFTFRWTVINVVFMTLLGFAVALIIRKKFIGKGFLKATMLIPWVLPQVVTGYIFSLMLSTDYGVVNKSATEYSLMEYNPLLSEEALLTEKADNKKKQFLASCEIFDCKNSDFDEMLPIQKAYELEEVVIDRDDFNEQNCRILLRRNIQSGLVFGVRHNSKVIAKASINAEGENCIQIGGIYTAEAFRNRGIATYLVRRLSNRLKNNGKNVVLFVKINNATAINVYNNCGYTTFNDYKIIYY